VNFLKVNGQTQFAKPTSHMQRGMTQTETAGDRGHQEFYWDLRLKVHESLY